MQEQRTVRLLIALTGMRNGEEWPPQGSLMDMPAWEAEDMVRNGYAEYAERPVPVSTAVEPEQAVVEADETADVADEPEQAVVEADETADVADEPEQTVVEAPERRGGKATKAR